jgi:hypothetical protein
VRLIVTCSRAALRRATEEQLQHREVAAHRFDTRDAFANINWRPGTRSKALRPLVSQIGRDVIEQYSEQSQSRNAVGGKHPDTTAFP